jgi:thiol-disulfide isomerase/thioredoxin
VGSGTDIEDKGDVVTEGFVQGQGQQHMVTQVHDIRSEHDLDTVLQLSPYTVCYSWSPDCQPCLDLKPYFSRVVQEYGGHGIGFAMQNVDDVMVVRVNVVPFFHVYQGTRVILGTSDLQETAEMLFRLKKI